MDGHDDLLDLERAAWDALSADGNAAAAFYGEVLASKVLMLLPGGLVIDDRDQVIIQCAQLHGLPSNSPTSEYST